MEGRQALRSLNLRPQIPKLCAISFLVGCTIEFIMCKSGFYNVYNVKQGQRKSTAEREEVEFWLRVNARRDAKEKAVMIDNS